MRPIAGLECSPNQKETTAMRSSVAKTCVVLLVFLVGVVTGCAVILLHPRLPLSAIQVDMARYTFKFKIPLP